MTNSREAILDKLNLQSRLKRPITGVSCGSGIVAKQVERGGADLILALNSGRFRQMGVSSLGGLLPFANSNAMVMGFGSRELVPAVQIPVIFGLNATDPTIHLEHFIHQIKRSGFSGINNFPTVGIFDRQLREALEEQDLGFDHEVKAIHIAHTMNLFTVAFVFDEEQAEKMLQAGADILCVHLGLTKGGLRGAKKVLSLDAGIKLAESIFSIKTPGRSKAIKMIYGGPVHTPADAEYVYHRTSVQGYFGGSVFDRMPAEKAVEERTREFKSIGQRATDHLLQQLLSKSTKHDYVEFVKEYVAVNYMDEICFADLAIIAKVSRAYLSLQFRKETGYTFPGYLANFRIYKACDIMKQKSIPLSQISQLVGYQDYSHFSKTFKRIIGTSPTVFLKSQHHNFF